MVTIMALRFVDSFDHYASALLTRKWFITDGGVGITAAQGRRGTSALRAQLSTYGVTKNFDNQATWIVGCAFRMGTLPIGAVAQVLKLIDGTSVQVDVRVNLDGTFSVTRNGTLLSTSTYVMPLSTYVYLEFKATISDAAGAYDLRINGASITSGSSVDTKNTANAYANRVALATSSLSASNCDFYFDDVYVCDGTGSANNDFLGDCRVDCYFPSGNGNSSQMVGSDGNSVDNYALVDEAAMNSDTDYVESSTVSNKDTYAFADITHSPTSIYGVQINMFAKKGDAGLRSIQSVTRSGGSDTDGTAKPLGTDYTDEMEMRETDPNTSAAWTISGFNAAEFGAKVAA
jgi:hypothetical protein